MRHHHVDVRFQLIVQFAGGGKERRPLRAVDSPHGGGVAPADGQAGSPPEPPVEPLETTLEIARTAGSLRTVEIPSVMSGFERANRAVQHTYEPGSTLKLVTAAAAAGVQHLAAPLGGHPGAEPVLVDPLAVARTITRLHRSNPFRVLRSGLWGGLAGSRQRQ